MSLRLPQNHRLLGQTVVPVTLSPNRMQSIGVKTGVVEYRTVRDEIRTFGNVEADETRLSDVQVRFSGWVQKVYADATYKTVRRGQPLLTIYSPELVTAEQDYLVAKELLRHGMGHVEPAGWQSLLNASAERMKRLEIPDREIARLKKTGKIRRDLEIDSPVSGIIVDKRAFPNMYVQPGMKLYSVADLSTVWVYAQLFQSDIGRVKVGDLATVTVDSYPGQTFPARVSFIWPAVDQTTRTTRVRLEIPNPEIKLSLGMFVNVLLGSPMGRQLVIPASGVFQSGAHQIAFVDHGKGYFEPRDIEVGARAGDDVIVLKGLEAGERIATSANFLIDSREPGSGGTGGLCTSTSRCGSGGIHECPARPGDTRILLEPIASARRQQCLSRQAHQRRRGGNHRRPSNRDVLHARHASDGNGSHAQCRHTR